MSSRPAGTRRPRLLPGAVLASVLVIASASGLLAATGGTAEPAVEACSPGQEWVTVHPVVVVADWRPAQSPPAGLELAGCLDTSRLGVERAAPDSRG